MQGVEWNEIIDGLNNEMEFTITDLSKCKISNHPIKDENGIILDINDSIKFLVKTSDSYGLRSFCEELNNSPSYSFVTNIKRIIWISLGEKTKRSGSFLCKMNDKRYGFLYAARGSCGFNSCSVGGSYSSIYLGTMDEIYKLGMDKRNRKYHDCHSVKFVNYM